MPQRTYIHHRGDDIEVGSIDTSGNVNLNGNSILSVASIFLNLAAGATVEEGAFVWDAEDGTALIGMPGGTAVSIGQELGFRAKNVSGLDIDNGMAIKITGAAGNNPTIDVATRAESPSADASIGFATEDIGKNQFGRFTVVGLVRDVNTSAWTKNTRLVLSDTDGVVVSYANRPLTFGRNVFMGIVLVQHATEGVILSFPLNVPFIDELSGVTITSPTDGQYLAYNSTTGGWENRDLPA